MAWNILRGRPVMYGVTVYANGWVWFPEPENSKSYFVENAFMSTEAEPPEDNDEWTYHLGPTRDLPAWERGVVNPPTER